MTNETVFKEDFARWYRPLELATDTAFAERRRAAVAALVDQVRLTDIEPLVRLAFATKQQPGTDKLVRIRQALASADDTFPARGNERELQLLCAATLAELFRRTGDVSAAAALAVSTAAAGGERRADLPQDLVEAAADAIQTLGDGRRARPDTSGAITVDLGKIGFDKAKAKVQEQSDWAGVAAAFDIFAVASKAAIVSAMEACSDRIEELSTTIAAQDEELQMLWWLIGERSWDLDRPFGEVPAPERVLVLSKELADQTAFVPGPPAILSLLARAGISERDEFTLQECVNACDMDWLRPLLDGMNPSPIMLPMHLAINRKLETEDSSAWLAGWAGVTGLNANRRLPATVVARLFYFERLLVGLTHTST